MKLFLKCLAVALLVGASHSFFPLFGMASALSIPILAPSASPLPGGTLQNFQEHNKMASLPNVLASWERIDRMKDKMEADMKKGVVPKDNYDFIVVGAGTGGSVVAARLSEHFSVLLLEAGGQPHANHDNPAMSMIMTKHPETDWMYSSVVQNDSCLLCPHRKYIFSAGKGLGGSANLNYLDTLYEGAFQDYSEWMETTQDPGWGYYMLQPYFKTVRDYMTKKYTISPGESQYYRSTYKALVRPTANLDVLKYSHVNKILYADDNGAQLEARGVEYERHGAVKQAFASKEVIISAGTFGTPKILMLSGIGPSHVLNSSQIAVKVDLPVGTNFHDHLAIPLGPFFKTKHDAEETSAEAKKKFADAWNSSAIMRMPLINLKYSLYAKETSHFLGMNETSLKEYMSTPQPPPATQRSKKSIVPVSVDDSMFINVAIKKPVSRGEVTISQNDPKLPPSISPNYLNAIYHHDTLAYSSEKQRLIEALEETVRLMEINPNVQTKFTDVSFPGCESYIFRGYGYWDCYIRHFSMSFNHGVGTCAMGAAATKAVVDPQLKVRGVENLRVIDASVIPILVGTYPFLTVVVVAEKGADMIIKQYQSIRKNGETISKLDVINEEEEDHSTH